MKKTFKYILAVLIILAPARVQADAIPPHIASMASQLYKGVEKDLKNKNLSSERKKALEESTKALRKLGVHRWSSSPAKISGKNIEALEKSYDSEPEDGRSVKMKWNPDTDKFSMKVLDDGSGKSEEFATALSGDVDPDLKVKPSDDPVKVLTSSDLESLKENIIGKWKSEDGTIFEFSATTKQAGEIRPPKEVFNKQIERNKEKIKTIKSSKIFKWRNKKTGEIIQQEKFHNLKEPFEYLGEKFAIENAQEEIAKLEEKITELMRERDGADLPLVDKHDPAGFSEASSSNGARPITITVTLTNGHVYTYDEAVFDGRRINAKRTYRVVPDLTNQKLPEIIKTKLVTQGWNPPGWLELDASIDAETGEVILDGLQWSMKVTYSSFFGDPPDIDRIHTPYSWNVTLSKDGAAFKIAEGAAEDLVP